MTDRRARMADACPLSGGSWRQIPELSDEFDGDRLDDSKWHDCNPDWLGRQPALFSRGNVSLSRGQLHLTARVEEPPEPMKAQGYHTFTAAAVKSKAKCLYGYFEVKARAMDSCTSSGFWFYCHEPNLWTEIDVFEICGGHGEKEQDVFMSRHVFITPTDGNKHWYESTAWKAPARLADDYHRYGLEWSKDEIKWYFDGQMVHSIPNTHWHQPLHMNFDVETQPEWFGLPSKESLPATFSIEYVRSWKRA